MLRAFGYPPERSAVVSMHVDTDLFRPLPKAACRAKLGLPRDAWILGYVGTFQPTHEIAILLDVLERIAGAGRDAHLVLVGGGNEEGAWRERARHSPHAERVHFVGAVPHERVPAYVNAFDVGFALLKREKAFAMEAHLKLKEYLACGVPAIVNECDADLFRDYPRGSVLFAPADDPERFTRAVLATGAGDEDGRSREQARAFVAERFNLAEAARRTLAFMRQLVGRQAASG